MKIQSQVSKLATNNLLNPSQYRAIVIAAELADGNKEISSVKIYEKLNFSKQYTYVLLTSIVEMGVLSKVSGKKDRYKFNSEDLWFSKKSEPQPKSESSLNTSEKNRLLAEVKALQDLTKELLNKLNQ